MGDTLSFYELIVSFTQLFVRSRTFDCPRNQRSCGLQQVDFHFVPEPLALAVVKAQRTPEYALHHDRY